MTGPEAIGMVSGGLGDPVIGRLGLPQVARPPAADASFGAILLAGMREVEAKIATANDLVRRFTLDDAVPLHQVTFALEEARLAVELAMQVRGRLVESYRELMNMQI